MLSPITIRRLQHFRANRRGYWSLWIFLSIFFVCIFAEVVANDKPLLVIFEGHFIFPVIETIPETEFGGEFATEAEYRDEFVRELIQKKGEIYWPMIRFSYDTINYDLPAAAPSHPTGENWFGTDHVGRDVFARVVYGSRISLIVGFGAAAFSVLFGAPLGLVSGYFRRLDMLIGRVVDGLMAMPTILLAIAFMQTVSRSRGIWRLMRRGGSGSSRISLTSTNAGASLP